MKPYRIPAYPSQIATWKRAAEPFAVWVQEKKDTLRRLSASELRQWHGMSERKPEPRKTPGSRSVLSEWVRLMLNAAAAGVLPVEYTDRKTLRGGPGRGRQWADGGPEEIMNQVQLRATPKEIKAWAAAAARQGHSNAEWARQVLTWAAENPQHALRLAG